MKKVDLERLVSEKPQLALELWLWFGDKGIAFNTGYPLGGAYIDSRVRGDATDKFYTHLDNTLVKQYPQFAGKYRRDITLK